MEVADAQCRESPVIGPPDPFEEESPLGDGPADLEADVTCPHCGENCSIGLDPGGGEEQEYVEDCPVCCRPWQVRLRYGPDGRAEVWVEGSDE